MLSLDGVDDACDNRERPEVATFVPADPIVRIDSGTQSKQPITRGDSGQRRFENSDREHSPVTRCGPLTGGTGLLLPLIVARMASASAFNGSSSSRNPTKPGICLKISFSLRSSIRSMLGFREGGGLGSMVRPFMFSIASAKAEAGRVREFDSEEGFHRGWWWEM